MAAVSPVTIHSSPRSLRFISITPPSAQQQRTSSDKTSSSPKLPSPSTFVPRRPAGLKPGSRAQPAPESAKLGFVSAASLWRDFAASVGDGRNDAAQELTRRGTVVEGGIENTTMATVTGKLKKPKKASKAIAASNAAATATELAEQDVYELPLQITTGPSASTVNTGLVESAAQTKAKKRATGVKPKGRPRKKAEPSGALQTGPSAKADRSSKEKGKAKSEEIILNSDDPEYDALVMYEEKKKPAYTAAEKPPRKRKVPAKSCKILDKKAGEQEIDVALTANGTERPNVPRAAEEAELPQRSTYFTKPGESPKSAALSQNDVSTSTYFSKANESAPLAIDSIPVPHQPPQPTNGAADVEFAVPELAVRRRRSWTPVLDTSTLQHSRPTTAGSEMSEPHAPKLNLAGIISNLSYVSGEMPPPASLSRTPSGEAVTKRRRIDLVETPATETASRFNHDANSLKQKTRTKAPKKKPQTITAVATAAFLPPKDPETISNAAVSVYFTGANTAMQTAEPNIAKNAEMPPPAQNPKRPRKRRVKIVDGDKASPQQGSVPKRKQASRQRKTPNAGKVNETKPQPRLYSPERAVARIQNQNFLFGTSSQLAPAESAEYIRDLQTALQQSEQHHVFPEMLSSPILASTQRIPSPQKKSSVKVPTAPHGTCLSIEQGTRELWSVASRDFCGGLLALDRRDAYRDEDFHEEIQYTVEDPTLAEPIPSATAASHTIIDLNSSPVAHTVIAELPIAFLGEGTETVVERQNSPVQEDDDSWNVLSSDDPPPSAQQHIRVLSPPLQKAQTSPGRPLPAFLYGKHAAASPFRPALHPLDSNLNFVSNISSEKPAISSQARAFSSTTHVFARESTRPRSRQRKTPDASENSLLLPKKRGRPPKTSTETTLSPPKSRSLKQAAPTVSRSRSALHSDFLDIDEISDSDSPKTPSPPRRRATSSPLEVPRLTLSPSRDALAPPVPVAGGPSLKPDGPQWPIVKTVLFPRITEHLKSAPRGTDPDHLSWWERILLYDPIVVEDLTSWLNEQGLYVQTSKKKVASKTKKGKGNGEGGEAGPEPDLEICIEALQPWMVQKWCEENSVCCYLKKGSWRGGRTKN